MRKFLTILIILAGIISSEAGTDCCWGQKREKGPTFGFELKFGMHSASHVIETANTWRHGKDGFVYGLEGQIGITPRFLISFGAEYRPLYLTHLWGWTPSLGEYTEDEGISLWPLNGGFKYYPPLPLGRRLKVFIVGGAIYNIGHYYLKASYSGGSTSRWKYNLGEYCGGGIEYFLLRWISIALNYRYNFAKIIDLGYSGYTININPKCVNGQVLLTSYFGRAPEIRKKTLKKKLTREEKVEIMREHYEKATNYYKKGKYEKAIREWEKVLEIDPNHKNSKICIEKARNKLKEK